MRSASTHAPAHLAGRGVDARREVDRDDRRRGGVDRLDLFRGLLARLAVEARPEERVDDHVCVVQRRILDRPGRPPCLLQHLDRDPPVTAVRALAADRDEPTRLREAPHRLLGDRPARPRHQLVDVVARLGCLHLLFGVERVEPRHRRRDTPPGRGRASGSSRARSSPRRRARPTPSSCRSASRPASAGRRSRSRAR